MSYSPRIMAFAGSARQGSFNKMLIRVAADAAVQAGAEVTSVDLRDYPMPLYDGDLEAAEGVPEMARRLRRLMQDHEGLLIASPEYNSSYAPLLKNVIDWTSRPDGDDPALVCYRGKTAALLAASPGALGGLRGLVHVRALLGNIGVTVLPEQLAVAGAPSVFDDAGRLTDPKLQTGVERVAERLVEVVRRLRG